MTFKSSRRRFIGVAAGFAAAGAASAVQAACRDPMPAIFDEMLDVVVVGSGFAGLAAALSAKLAGADVLVIEKMAFIGGNSSLSGGMIAVPTGGVYFVNHFCVHGVLFDSANAMAAVLIFLLVGGSLATYRKRPTVMVEVK